MLRINYHDERRTFSLVGARHLSWPLSPVAGIEFSDDTDDGVFLLSACHDKTAQIRSGDTGDWIGTFEGHKGAVWGAALNKPATRAATASGDFSAKVWDALTGDELLELKHRHIVRCCDWSADSTNLVTGGKEGKLRLYDINQPEAEPNMLLGHESMKAIKCLRYTPDPSGKIFLSGGDDKTLRLWDVRTLSEVKKLDFDGPVNSVELSRDEKTLTVAAGTEVSFWDTSNYECLKKFTLGVIEANGYGVNSATLHPDRKAFVAGRELLGLCARLRDGRGALVQQGSSRARLRHALHAGRQDVRVRRR